MFCKINSCSPSILRSNLFSSASNLLFTANTAATTEAVSNSVQPIEAKNDSGHYGFHV